MSKKTIIEKLSSAKLLSKAQILILQNSSDDQGFFTNLMTIYEQNAKNYLDSCKKEVISDILNKNNSPKDHLDAIAEHHIVDSTYSFILDASKGSLLMSLIRLLKINMPELAASLGVSNVIKSENNAFSIANLSKQITKVFINYFARYRLFIDVGHVELKDICQIRVGNNDLFPQSLLDSFLWQTSIEDGILKSINSQNLDNTKFIEHWSKEFAKRLEKDRNSFSLNLRNFVLYICQIIKQTEIGNEEKKLFFMHLDDKTKFSSFADQICEDYIAAISSDTDVVKIFKNNQTVMCNDFSKICCDKLLTLGMNVAGIASKPKTEVISLRPHGKKLIVKGYVIKSSQLDTEIEKIEDLREIEVQSIHRIIIDEDLSATAQDKDNKCKGKLHGANLSLIAPYVTISDKRIIDLSGKAGEEYGAPAANGGVDAYGNGVEGTEGNSGLPGSSAGNLFILCEHAQDIDKLEVILNGGKGGKGQTGGNGGNGLPGAAWNPNNVPPNPYNPKDGWYAIQDRHEIGGRTSLARHQHDGEIGKNGGKAGDGGAGGLGGKGGSLIFSCLSNDLAVSVNLSNDAGNGGDPGRTGLPGNGGANGAHAQRTYRWFHNGEKWDGDPKNVEYPGSGNVGADGKVGIRTNIKTGIINCNPALNLLNYKMYINLELRKKELVKLNDLAIMFNNHLNITSIRDQRPGINNFFDEVTALAEYYPLYGANMDFGQLYYSLLSRIRNFTLSLDQTNKDYLNQIKLLEYLFTATLAELALYHSAKENLLIINLKSYIEHLINGELKALEQIEKDVLKKHYQQRYEDRIQDKINEATEIIKKIKQVVTKSQEKINVLIDNLNQEVAEEQQKVVNHMAALNEQKRKIKEAQHKSMILAVAGITAQAVGMCAGPCGAIIAPIVTTGLQMALQPSVETVGTFVSAVANMKLQIDALLKAVEQQPNGTASQLEKDGLNILCGVIKDIIPVVQIAGTYIRQSQEINQQINSINKQIDDLDSLYNKLNSYLKSIPKATTNYLDATIKSISDFQETLKDRSLAFLDFGRLEIRVFCNNVKSVLKSLLGKFEAAEGFYDLVNELNDAIDVTINVQCRIQDQHEHKHLIQFLLHITDTSINDASLPAEFQMQIAALKKVLQKSVVQEAYHRAIAATKQWAFPFPEKFFGSIQDFDNENIDFPTMQKNLLYIFNRINTYHDTCHNIDQSIYLNNFGMSKPNQNSYSTPFFTWSYGDFPTKIENLLQGEHVVLQAYPKKIDFEAVKFSKIGLHIEYSPDIEQKDLENILAKYRVTLKYPGTSYYKYHGVIYQISTMQPIIMEFQYGCSTGSDSTHVFNLAWSKISSGDLTLSPYSTWIVQLEPLSNTNNNNLPILTLWDKLKSHKDTIKIHLIGEGSYVKDRTTDYDDSHLKQYYTVVEDLETINEDEQTSSQDTPRFNRQ